MLETTTIIRSDRTLSTTSEIYPSLHKANKSYSWKSCGQLYQRGSENQRTLEAVSDLKISPSPTPLSQQDPLEQITQEHIQVCFLCPHITGTVLSLQLYGSTYASGILFNQATLRNDEQMIYSRAPGAASALQVLTPAMNYFQKLLSSGFEAPEGVLFSQKDISRSKTHIGLNLLHARSCTQWSFGRKAPERQPTQHHHPLFPFLLDLVQPGEDKTVGWT